MILKAKCGVNGILDNSKIKEIGFIEKSKRISEEGNYLEINKVCFHFGIEATDIFYFEHDQLVYSDISNQTPFYLNELYKKLLLIDKINQKTLIEKVTCHYVLVEMGF